MIAPPLDPLESLWPDAVEVHRAELAIDGYWARTLVPRGWPHEVSPGWLESLVQFGHPSTVAVRLEPMAGTDEMRRLTRHLIWNQGVREAAERQGRLPDPGQTAAVQDAHRLRADLATGETRLYRVGLAITLRAPSRAMLDQRTALLESLGTSLMLPFRRLPYRQAETWGATLPGGDPPPGMREMDSRAAATLFPFIGGDDVQHPGGQVWGENPRTRVPVILDRNLLPAPHSLTIGWSGSGKSFAAKLLALRARYHGIPVLVIDPEGEYRQLAGEGAVVRVGQGTGLNPLAMGAGPLERARRQEFAVRWLEVLAGPVGVRARSVLEQSLADHGELTPTSWLQDLRTRDPRTARRVEGPLLRWRAVIGEGGGTIPDQGLTVIDLSGVPPALKVGAYLVAVEHVLATLQFRRQRWVLFDEAWHLLSHPLLAPYLEELYRRARKWRTVLTLVTQDAQDALRSPAAQVCLRNSPIVLLLKPHPEALPELETLFRLTPAEAAVLGGSGIGEGLLLVDRLRIPLRVRASPMEEALLSARAPVRQWDAQDEEDGGDHDGS
jgi:conjugal transfer ATP-binding protein TraC